MWVLSLFPVALFPSCRQGMTTVAQPLKPVFVHVVNPPREYPEFPESREKIKGDLMAKPVIGIKEPAPANFPILLKMFNPVKKALIPIKIIETIVPEISCESSRDLQIFNITIIFIYDTSSLSYLLSCSFVITISRSIRL